MPTPEAPTPSPCPVCSAGGGFHDAEKHAEVVIPRENIKPKGWHTNAQPTTTVNPATSNPTNNTSTRTAPHPTAAPKVNP